jgi:hypothetical protein
MGKDSGMARGHSRENGFKKTKNSTNEASMLLKAHNGGGNEAKKYMETNELCENIVKEAEKLLKTGHIAILTGAKYVRLSPKSAQI